MCARVACPTWSCGPSTSPLAAMATFYLAPKDARGRLIRKGSRVRIVGMPDVSGIRDRRARRHVACVFQHLQGQIKKVRGFSRYGFAEISFKLRRRGPLGGWHGIEIEPKLLLAQRGRP